MSRYIDAGLRRTVVLLLLTTLATPLVAESFARTYKLGLSSAERRDWEDVERRMRESIAANPWASARHPRLLMKRYIPHFYLGLALYEQGDCPGALAAFKESERHDVIVGMDEYRDLRSKKRSCERLAQEELVHLRVEASSRGKAAAERARESAMAVAQLKENRELDAVWEWRENSLAARDQRANELLDQAEATLNRDPAVLSMEEIERALEQASQARWQLEAIRVEASQHLEEARKLTARQRTDLSRLVGDARSLKGSVAQFAPYPPQMSQRLATLDRLLANVQREQADATPDRLAQLQDDLRAAIRQLRAASTPPPKELEAAVTTFFSGDYQGTLELLANPAGSARARAHAHLLRAASQFALYRSGQADPQMLTSARADVARCRQLDRSLEPVETVFSPVFIEFFARGSADS